MYDILAVKPEIKEICKNVSGTTFFHYFFLFWKSQFLQKYV